MAATYEIVSQTPRTRAEGGSTFTQVVVVQFRTKPSGQIGSVEIPAQVFTPDEVDRLVSARAELIEAVQAL